MNALAQRRMALQSANPVRLRRAEVRRGIAQASNRAASQVKALAVLRDPEPACRGMSAYRLLTAVRSIGTRKATSLLMRAGVPQHKPLGDLTDRQRTRLAELLGVA